MINETEGKKKKKEENIAKLFQEIQVVGSSVQHQQQQKHRDGEHAKQIGQIRSEKHVGSRIAKLNEHHLSSKQVVITSGSGIMTDSQILTNLDQSNSRQWSMLIQSPQFISKLDSLLNFNYLSSSSEKAIMLKGKLIDNVSCKICSRRADSCCCCCCHCSRISNHALVHSTSHQQTMNQHNSKSLKHNINSRASLYRNSMNQQNRFKLSPASLALALFLTYLMMLVSLAFGAPTVNKVAGQQYQLQTQTIADIVNHNHVLKQTTEASKNLINSKHLAPQQQQQTIGRLLTEARLLANEEQRLLQTDSYDDDSSYGGSSYVIKLGDRSTAAADALDEAAAVIASDDADEKILLVLANDSSAQPKTTSLRRLIKRSGISDQRLAEIQMIRALKKQLERATKLALDSNQGSGTPFSDGGEQKSTS